MKEDADLFRKVAIKLDIRPGSLVSALDRNIKKLTQYDTVVMIAQHMGKNPEDLLEREKAIQPKHYKV